jgi:hypothetical protein
MPAVAVAMTCGPALAGREAPASVQTDDSYCEEVLAIDFGCATVSRRFAEDVRV